MKSFVSRERDNNLKMINNVSKKNEADRLFIIRYEIYPLKYIYIYIETYTDKMKVYVSGERGDF